MAWTKEKHTEHDWTKVRIKWGWFKTQWFHSWFKIPQWIKEKNIEHDWTNIKH